MIVRREVAADVEAVDALTRAAFGRDLEADLLVALRADDAWLPQFSLVAEPPGGGPVVGHVVATRARVGDAPALGIGPVSVRPDQQRSGVGSALLHAVVGAAGARSEPLLVLLGRPAFYGRFGFRPATELGVTAPVEAWGEHFQALALSPDAPTGAFRYAAPFDAV